MMSGRGVVAFGTYRSVGSTRVAEYAAFPGVAVGRVVSTKTSWRTVKPNGRWSTTRGRTVVVDFRLELVGFDDADAHAPTASTHTATTA